MTNERRKRCSTSGNANKKYNRYDCITLDQKKISKSNNTKCWGSEATKTHIAAGLTQ